MVCLVRVHGCRSTQQLDLRGAVWRIKHAGAGNEGIRPGLRCGHYGRLVYAAVDLQPDVQFGFGDSILQQCELWHGLFHERLAAEARLHRHDQDLVELFEQLQIRLDPGARFHGEASPRPDLPQPPCQGDRVRGRLGVEGDGVRSQLRVFRRPAIGVGDHQMNIERNR